MVVKTKISQSEIGQGKAKSYTVGEVKIVVCNIDGKYFAVEDVCSHDDGELVSGEVDLVDVCQLQCPRHGARFDVKTGEAKRMPAAAPIATFQVKDLGQDLEIVMED